MLVNCEICYKTLFELFVFYQVLSAGTTWYITSLEQQLQATGRPTYIIKNISHLNEHGFPGKAKTIYIKSLKHYHCYMYSLCT